MPQFHDADEQRRRTRNAFLVFGLCLAISTVIAVLLFRQYRQDLPATQDLVIGLIYFIETHGGRFPESEGELRGAPFVENTPDGGFRILARPESNYRRTTHGFVFHDLQAFEIAWGADLSMMAIDERGRLRDGAGNEVSLVRWPSSPNSGRIYSPLLLEASRRVRNGPESVTGHPASDSATRP